MDLEDFLGLYILLYSSVFLRSNHYMYNIKYAVGSRYKWYLWFTCLWQVVRLNIFPNAFGCEQPFCIWPCKCYFMFVCYKSLVIFSCLSRNAVHAEKVQMLRDYKCHSTAAFANSIIWYSLHWKIKRIPCDLMIFKRASWLWVSYHLILISLHGL